MELINFIKSKLRGKRDLSPINYSINSVPRGYKCDTCNATNCKLWREYCTFGKIALECVDCAIQSQSVPGTSSLGKYAKVEVAEDGTWLTDFGIRSDSLGWRVPAIPDEEGVGYWGYTSVPSSGINWWKGLPLRNKR